MKRYEVEATVVGAGAVKHVIKAKDEAEALQKYHRAHQKDTYMYARVVATHDILTNATKAVTFVPKSSLRRVTW